MAKKASEVTQSQLDHRRKLAKIRQKRHRNNLQGAALEEYRARCSQYQKRYKARQQGLGSSDNESRPRKRRRSDSDQSQERECGPSPQIHRQTEAGSSHQVQHQTRQLRPRPWRTGASQHRENEIQLAHSHRTTRSQAERQATPATEEDEQPHKTCRKHTRNIILSDDERDVSYGIDCGGSDGANGVLEALGAADFQANAAGSVELRDNNGTDAPNRDACDTADFNNYSSDYGHQTDYAGLPLPRTLSPQPTDESDCEEVYRILGSDEDTFLPSSSGEVVERGHFQKIRKSISEDDSEGEVDQLQDDSDRESRLRRTAIEIPAAQQQADNLKNQFYEPANPATLFHPDDTVQDGSVAPQSQGEGHKSRHRLVLRIPIPKNFKPTWRQNKELASPPPRPKNLSPAPHPSPALSSTSGYSAMESGSCMDPGSAPASDESRREDLVTGILGVQVHPQAPAVKWSSGQHTVLPFLPKRDKRRRLRNLLAKDARYVTAMARLPEATLSSSQVSFLDKNMDTGDLFYAAREALSHDKVAIVRDYVDTHGFKFTLDDLDKHFSVTPHRCVQVHDMAARLHDYSTPHVDTTVQEFIDGIADTNVSRVALGFPLPQYNLPWPFEKLDDGLSLGWAQTQSHAPIHHTPIPADVWTVRSWGLAHHAAITTYPHHDAEGAATFMIVQSGTKNWVVIGVEHAERHNLADFLAEISSDDACLLDYAGRIKSETVHLHAGDLMIMPPGKHHAVFTPVAGFSRGGHFFNLDTMHLTELSRFVDARVGKFITNETHSGTLETLCRLVISLTVVPKSRKLYKRPLVALCGMVLHHQKYTAQKAEQQQSATLPMAAGIASAVLDFFGLPNFERYASFLTEGNASDRGEEVEVHDFLHLLHAN